MPVSISCCKRAPGRLSTQVSVVGEGKRTAAFKLNHCDLVDVRAFPCSDVQLSLKHVP